MGLKDHMSSRILCKRLSQDSCNLHHEVGVQVSDRHVQFVQPIQRALKLPPQTYYFANAAQLLKD